jgi:hypothetical protein
MWTYEKEAGDDAPEEDPLANLEWYRDTGILVTRLTAVEDGIRPTGGR